MSKPSEKEKKAEPLLNYMRKYIELPPEEEAFLLENIIFRKYLKGQFVVQQGDICRNENFVVQGCLKTFFIDSEGHEHVIMLAIENWWTSDLASYITQTPADYHVQCLENSELIQFPYDKLEEMYSRISGLDRFFRIIIQKAYIASEKRNIRNLSLTAKQRYLQFKEQYPEIEARVPQYLVASYLGITKEFLSKIKNQLLHDAS